MEKCGKWSQRILSCQEINLPLELKYIKMIKLAG